LRVLVVHCHPVETSYSAALHERVLASLAAAGHQVTDLDLYKTGFEAAMPRQERVDYHNPATVSAAIEPYTRQLAEIEGVVLVYPTWWFGMPALLKGYFDRVWKPGIAFDVERGVGVEPDRLKHIHHFAVVTTYGSPWWIIRLYMGSPDRKVLKRGLGKLCAADCRIQWLALYDMDTPSPAKRAAFLDRVARAMGRL
jgi:putative NADPH-quinone reductase